MSRSGSTERDDSIVNAVGAVAASPPWRHLLKVGEG